MRRSLQAEGENDMVLSQAIASVASVGLGCGAGCGSSASAFLTTYALSEGRGTKAALRQVASFYLGRTLAILSVCAAGSLLGQVFIHETGTLFGFPLNKLVYVVMLCTAVWLLWDWFRARKGCAGCKHCGSKLRTVPSFAVGAAYGLSPCAPLLMVVGYAAALPLGGALVMGTVFVAASSLVPAMLTLALSGTLSRQIVRQIGGFLPWLQLGVYALYFIAAIRGLVL